MTDQSGEGYDTGDDADRVLGDAPRIPEDVWERAMTHALDPANSYDPELVPEQPDPVGGELDDDHPLDGGDSEVDADPWSGDDARWDPPSDPFDHDPLDDDLGSDADGLL